MRDKFNTYAVLTDTAKTITVTHTWERTQTFSPTSGVGINVTTGGISVTGTAALAAVTCTTVTASGAISGTTGTFSSTLQGGQTVQAVAGSVTSRLSADSGNGWGTLGTYSNHAFKFVSNSITRGELTAAGVFELDNITSKSITVSGGTTAVQAFTASTGSFSSTLAVTGAATFSSTINGQTISSAASFTGSVAVANGLTVAAGTTAVQALTCTTLAPSGITTLSGTGATYALDFTGAAGRLRLANNGSLTFVQNDGSTSVLSIDEASGSVRVPFDLFIGTGNNISGSAGDGAGFLVLPTMGSAPSGTPSSGAGEAPCVVDTSNLRLYIRVNGTWRYATLT